MKKTFYHKHFTSPVVADGIAGGSSCHSYDSCTRHLHETCSLNIHNDTTLLVVTMESIIHNKVFSEAPNGS